MKLPWKLGVEWQARNLTNNQMKCYGEKQSRSTRSGCQEVLV